MEERKVSSAVRILLFVTILTLVGGLAFAAGLAWSSGTAQAAETAPSKKAPAKDAKSKDDAKVVYPKETELDFEGMKLQGEVRNPGEFYFQHRPEEKFDSLVKRRKNFHKEMLRDAVSGK